MKSVFFNLAWCLAICISSASRYIEEWHLQLQNTSWRTRPTASGCFGIHNSFRRVPS